MRCFTELRKPNYAVSISSMKKLIIGYDSAWTAHRKGAIVAAITQSDKTRSSRQLKLLGAPLIVDWAGALNQVRAWMQTNAPDSTKIYIDQPTIVNNSSGQRPVENIVGSLISYHFGGMQPSSLKRDDMFGPSAPISNFINALNANVELQASSAPIRVIETYPALSIIAKGWLNSVESPVRTRLPKYNPENRNRFSLEDWKRLCQQLTEDFRRTGLSEICNYLGTIQTLIKPKKYDQDALDACLCLMAGLADDHGEAMSIGNSDTGFIVVPHGELAYKMLEARCVATGREPGAWLQHEAQHITCEQASVDDVVEVLSAVPEIQSHNLIQSILDRISAKKYLALVAYRGNQPVGCKLGYALDTDSFYSWLGGVVPEYRGQGIAQQLLKRQEAWAKQAGFKNLQVKSMNRYPAMLHMLIKNGYQVCGYEDKGMVEKSRILFSKGLV